MAKLPGRWKPLSVNRRFIAEMMAVTDDMPIITIERRMPLADLILARQSLGSPPSWVAIFARAFALVAARRPDLRRAYMPHPWPHYYETDGTIASIAIEREFEGEPVVLFGKFFRPESQSLEKLQQAIEHWRSAPIHTVRDFKRIYTFMRLPRPIRKFCWWYMSTVAGRHRVRHLGTFGISTTASSGATCRNLIAPIPLTMNYGTFAEDGTLDVRLHFDHRVLDGMPAARALAELERELRTTILAELQQLAVASKPDKVPVAIPETVR